MTDFDLFTDRARKIMMLAKQESLRFGHDWVGTEHILIGLLKEGVGLGANVLRLLGLDLHNVRLEVEKLLTQGDRISTTYSSSLTPSLTPRAKLVVKYANEESKSLGHNYVGTEHVLLGLLKSQEGVASQVLAGLGVKTEDVRYRILEMLDHPKAYEEKQGRQKCELAVEQIKEVLAQNMDVILAYAKIKEIFC